MVPSPGPVGEVEKGDPLNRMPLRGAGDGVDEPTRNPFSRTVPEGTVMIQIKTSNQKP